MDGFLILCGLALVILVIGFLMNGFPNIHIGPKNYYDKNGKK